MGVGGEREGKEDMRKFYSVRSHQNAYPIIISLMSFCFKFKLYFLILIFFHVFFLRKKITYSLSFSLVNLPLLFYNCPSLKIFIQ